MADDSIFFSIKLFIAQLQIWLIVIELSVIQKRL